jgi:hypothetical protein
LFIGWREERGEREWEGGGEGEGGGAEGEGGENKRKGAEKEAGLRGLLREENVIYVREQSSFFAFLNLFLSGRDPITLSYRLKGLFG